MYKPINMDSTVFYALEKQLCEILNADPAFKGIKSRSYVGSVTRTSYLKVDFDFYGDPNDPAPEPVELCLSVIQQKYTRLKFITSNILTFGFNERPGKGCVTEGQLLGSIGPIDLKKLMAKGPNDFKEMMLNILQVGINDTMEKWKIELERVINSN